MQGSEGSRLPGPGLREGCGHKQRGLGNPSQRWHALISCAANPLYGVGKVGGGAAKLGGVVSVRGQRG